MIYRCKVYLKLNNFKCKSLYINIIDKTTQVAVAPHPGNHTKEELD